MAMRASCLKNRINKMYPNRILYIIKFSIIIVIIFNSISLIFVHSAFLFYDLWNEKRNNDFCILYRLNWEQRRFVSLDILRKFNMISVMKCFWNCVMLSAAWMQDHNVFNLEWCSFSVFSKMSTNFIRI